MEDAVKIKFASFPTEVQERDYAFAKKEQYLTEH
jgi:hypothetical protein